MTMEKKRIAILGANGQVGAEVSLLLRNHPQVEVIPVCRNRSGSAFLRYHGVACRHGLPADPAQAPRLFGDCDLIANLALGGGTPRQIRETDRLLSEHAFRYSLPHAKVIYFSTAMVHGDPRPGVMIRWRGSYGRAKLHSERIVDRAAARYGKPAFVLRLGHVCGELQNISSGICRQLRGDVVALPREDHLSNTVYTATIVDAILKVLGDREAPGTYDLMNQPQWTWRQVYEYEAGRCGVALRVDIQSPRARAMHRRLVSLLLRTARGMSSSLIGGRSKDVVMRLMASLPRRFNERIQASWYRHRAGSEIAALRRPAAAVDESLTWVPLGKTSLRSLSPTLDLLRDPLYRIPLCDETREWPADLPYSDKGVGANSSTAAVTATTSS